MIRIEDLELSTVDTSATIRFDRPSKKNAFNPKNHAAMHEVIDRLERIPTLKSVVLTGTADVFCGGMDLEEYFLDAFDDVDKLRSNFRASHGWMRRWKDLDAVTIAKINGWCV